MYTSRSYRPNSQIITGLLIILLGIIFLLDNFDIIEAHEIFRFWPVLLIIFGLLRISKPDNPGGRFFGFVMLIIGMLLFLDRLYFIRFHFWDLWPLVFILGGLSLLLKSKRFSRSGTDAMPATGTAGTISEIQELPGGSTADPGQPAGQADYDSFINLSAFLGGYARSIRSQDFRGGNITAVMAGCDVDLRQASIKGGPAVLNVFAFWGGMEIKVPSDWTVFLEGTPILGGFEDRTLQPHPDTGKRLIIRGEAIMGGIKVSN